MFLSKYISRLISKKEFEIVFILIIAAGSSQTARRILNSLFLHGEINYLKILFSLVLLCMLLWALGKRDKMGYCLSIFYCLGILAISINGLYIFAPLLEDAINKNLTEFVSVLMTTNILLSLELLISVVTAALLVSLLRGITKR